MTVPLKAPFPYFGGKRTVADLIWQRLGSDCTNYCEPFAGSLACLLARPLPFRGVETVNDVNAYVTNFWRATATRPEEVVDHCNWPVSELDLHSRHRWLVLSPEAIAFRERLRVDPDYCDPKLAGWWVWGACCWIGGGWCQYQDGASEQNKQRPACSHLANGGHRLPNKRPSIASEWDIGCGIHATANPSAQIPDLSSGGVGDDANAGEEQHRNRPRLTNDAALRAGPRQGGRPQLADAYDVGRGVHAEGDIGTCEQRRLWLLDWFRRLQDRLRLVRICCGHWARVCASKSVTTRLGTTGVFLDPPYPLVRKGTSKASRSKGLYQGDSHTELEQLRDEVLAWCQERGSDPLMRIALACYEDDGYEPLEQQGWRVESWEAQGGYANRSKGDTKENRRRERLYFSPHCVFEAGLFDGLAIEQAQDYDPCQE